jgi:GxxExxY protein
MNQEDSLSREIIGAAIEVHRHLGPGLLESVYEHRLCKELAEWDIPYRRQLPLAVKYKGEVLDCGYRLDVVVDNKVIVELKSVNTLEPIYEAQVLTYLKLLDCKLGLLINFNVPVLKRGIKRIVNNL